MSARRIKNEVKNKRIITDILEQESRAMEQRLMELKITMNREREERESLGMNGHWRKGEKGALFSYKPQLKANDLSTKITKVKVLKDEEIVIPKRKKFQIPKQDSNKCKGPPCGQCEMQKAYVYCQECGEEFCAKCFAAFHLKGALRKHRSVPLSDMSGRVSSARKHSTGIGPDSAMSYEMDLTPDRETPPLKSNMWMVDSASPPMTAAAKVTVSSVAVEASSATTNTTTTVMMPKRRPLSSSRRHRPAANHSTDMTDAPFELNANLSQRESKKALKIEFHSTLSYAEQLLLKKHRRQEIGPLPNVLTEGDNQDLHSLASTLSARSQVGGDSLTRRSVVSMNGDSLPWKENNIPWEAMASVYPRPMSVTPLFPERQDEATSNNVTAANAETESDTVEMETHDSTGKEMRNKTDKSRASSRANARTPRKVATPKTPYNKSMGGLMTHQPSDRLLAVTAHNAAAAEMTESFATASNSWLTLDVEKAGNENEERPASGRVSQSSSHRPVSARSAKQQKVSYTLYAMSPRSWKPDESVSTTAVIATELLRCSPMLSTSLEAAFREERMTWKKSKEQSFLLNKPSKTSLDLAEDEGRSDDDEELESARKLEEDIFRASRVSSVLSDADSIDSVDPQDTNTINSEDLLREAMNLNATSSDDDDDLCLQDSLDVANLS